MLTIHSSTNSSCLFFMILSLLSFCLWQLMPLGFLAAPWPSFADALGAQAALRSTSVSPPPPRGGLLASPPSTARPACTRSTRPRFRLNRTLSKTPRSQKLLDFRGNFHQKRRNFAFSRAATREGKQLVQQAARAMANRPTASFEEKVRVREN